MKRAAAVLAAILVALACGRDERPTAPAPGGFSLWQFGGHWTRAGDGELELASLRGTPVLLLFFYGSCQSTCPLLVHELRALEGRLPVEARDEVRFVLVTIDPERDTPERLAAYAREQALDPARWLLLRGAPEQVRELTAALGVRYRNAGDQLSHTARVFLLDRDGVELEHWDGTSPPLESLARAVTAATRRG